ncbi:MAG TPA: Fur family transcriptional regulator [Tissierellaceae bacterium]
MKINIKKYEETLKNQGYKLTSQRKIILKALVDHKDEHLSCDDLFKIISEQNPDIGIATIYRTLQLFEELKIVYKLNFNDGFSRYELNLGTEEHHHHHLICLKCGKVIEVKVDLLDSLEEEIEKNDNFTIVDHNVKFYGYCSECK